MGMARVAIAIATLLTFNLVIINPSLSVAQIPLPNQLVLTDNVPIPKMPVPDNNLPGPYGYRLQQPQNKPPQQPNEQPQPIQQQLPNEQPDVIDINLFRENFYGQSCPRAEEIVAKAVADLFRQDPQSLAILLRLQFHDCFVGVSFSYPCYYIAISFINCIIQVPIMN